MNTSTDTINRLVTRGLNDEPLQDIEESLKGCSKKELRGIVAGLLGHTVASLQVLAIYQDTDAHKLWANTNLFVEIHEMKL